jgi:SPX domain protein involved in polyphosphate accumulation
VSFRKEKKYRVTKFESEKLFKVLSKNGMKLLHKPRVINSVYFDNNSYDMFYNSEEGVVPRKKIRIRWYNNKINFSLEKKTSSVEGRFKSSNKYDILKSITQIENHNMIDNNYGYIYPSLKVSYLRTYYTFNKMRVTLDKNINYRNLRNDSFTLYEDPENVIEIKVQEEFSDDIIEKFMPYSTSRFSKYSRGLLLSQHQISKN